MHNIADMRARQVSGWRGAGAPGRGREGENERGGVVEISGLDNDDDVDNMRSRAADTASNDRRDACRMSVVRARGGLPMKLLKLPPLLRTRAMNQQETSSVCGGRRQEEASRYNRGGAVPPSPTLPTTANARQLRHHRRLLLH